MIYVRDIFFYLIEYIFLIWICVIVINDGVLFEVVIKNVYWCILV